MDPRLPHLRCLRFNRSPIELQILERGFILVVGLHCVTPLAHTSRGLCSMYTAPRMKSRMNSDRVHGQELNIASGQTYFHEACGDHQKKTEKVRLLPLLHRTTFPNRAREVRNSDYSDT
jgi:hypothetical protein